MSLEKFTKNLQDFVVELNLTFPETPINDTVFNVVTEDQMETFLTEMKPYIHEVSKYNPDSFKNEEPIVILEHLELTRYFNHNISNSTMKSIFNYLHILYILAFRYLREINTDVDLNSDEPSESELFFTLVKNIRRSKQEPEDCCENETCEAGDNPLNSLFGAGGGGLIGELAEDIARDINIEDLGNPMDLMGMLMGGKSDSAASGNIMNLIKKVGDKVKNKIDSGELDQGQLLNEAQNLMGNMGNLGNLGGGAGGLDLGGLDIGNMAKMLSGMMPGAPSEATLNRRISNNKDVALMQRKERLRKRLAERKARELEKNTEPEDAESSGKRRRRRRKKKRKEKVEENSN